MDTLGASIIVVFLAPLINGWLRGREVAKSAVEGFVVVLVATIVFAHLLPHSFEHVGWAAVALFLVGLFVPNILEVGLRKSSHVIHLGTLVVAAGGIALHGAMDGALLSATGAGVLAPVAIAIVLHRLVMAYAIWSRLESLRGLSWAVGFGALLILATVAGFWLGEGFHGHAGFVEVLQALVGGTVLHSVLHSAHGVHTKRQTRASAVGALGGLVLAAWYLQMTESELPLQIWNSFMGLLAATAPALVLAFFIAGLMHGFLPGAPIRWINKGTDGQKALRGVLFGMPLPVCSCGVVPLFQGLVKKGAASPAALAFLVATPEIGLDAVLISLPLLGGEFTVARVASAFLVALIIGWYVGRRCKEPKVLQESEAGHCCPSEDKVPSATFSEKAKQGVRYGFVELVDDIFPWMLAGLVVAAAITPIALSPDGQSWLQGLPVGVDILVCAVLGVPIYVCASGATPLVAVLVAAGVSPGAGLALLLSGPATNVTTFGVLSQTYSRSIALWFWGGLVLLSIASGFALNAVWSGGEIPAAMAHSHGGFAVYEWISIALLSVIALFAFLRTGPFGVVDTLVEGFSTGKGHEHSESSHEGGCH